MVRIPDSTWLITFTITHKQGEKGGATQLTGKLCKGNSTTSVNKVTRGKTLYSQWQPSYRDWSNFPNELQNPTEAPRVQKKTIKSYHEKFTEKRNHM